MQTSSRSGCWWNVHNDEDLISLEIFWIRDEPREDSANLSEADVLAQEIADDLRTRHGGVKIADVEAA